MFKQFSRIFLVALSLLFIAGCSSSRKNIKLNDEFWQNNKNHKIVIAKVKKPKAGLTKTGSQGILDFAINSAVTNSFDKHLTNYADLNWYDQMPNKFASGLNERNITAQIYPTALKDSKLKNTNFVFEMEGNKLLTIELENIGAIRNYYSVIPTGAPKAYCVIKGELIDQTDKKVLWRHIMTVEEPVQGEWDQPPYYPNFNKALAHATTLAQEEIIDSFFSGH